MNNKINFTCVGHPSYSLSGERDKLETLQNTLVKVKWGCQSGRQLLTVVRIPRLGFRPERRPPPRRAQTDSPSKSEGWQSQAHTTRERHRTGPSDQYLHFRMMIYSGVRIRDMTVRRQDNENHKWDQRLYAIVYNWTHKT